MKQKKTAWQHLLDQTELGEEGLPGQPIVELLGDSRVLIENHRRITEYDLDRICIRVSFGTVRVRGCNLRLRQVTGRKLLIIGKIENVELLRGQR